MTWADNPKFAIMDCFYDGNIKAVWYCAKGHKYDWSLQRGKKNLSCQPRIYNKDTFTSEGRTADEQRVASLWNRSSNPATTSNTKFNYYFL